MERQEIEQEKSEFSGIIKFFNSINTLIFGKKAPSTLLKVSIYLNLVIWSIFELWHILSFSAISFRAVILQEKKINVEILIFNRGAELNYDPWVFLTHLLNFHAISCIIWLMFFIGIVFMWRKLNSYKYLTIGALISYFVILFFYMGFEYMMNDTTFFDKIIYFLALANTIAFTIILNLENSNLQEEDFEEELID